MNKEMRRDILFCCCAAPRRRHARLKKAKRRADDARLFAKAGLFINARRAMLYARDEALRAG